MADNDESKFMLAAEQAVRDLQVQARDAAAAAVEAKKAATRADKSAKRWKKLTTVLAFFIVLCFGIAVVTGYYVNQTRNNANSLRQQSIASCESGNDLRVQLNQSLTKQFAATNLVTEKAIAQFITVLEGKAPKPEVVAIATALEAQIKHSADMSQQQFKKDLDKATAPRDCAQAYTANTTAPSSLGSLYVGGIPVAVALR